MNSASVVGFNTCIYLTIAFPAPGISSCTHTRFYISGEGDIPIIVNNLVQRYSHVGYKDTEYCHVRPMMGMPLNQANSLLIEILESYSGGMTGSARTWQRKKCDLTLHVQVSPSNSALPGPLEGRVELSSLAMNDQNVEEVLEQYVRVSRFICSAVERIVEGKYHQDFLNNLSEMLATEPQAAHKHRLEIRIGRGDFLGPSLSSLSELSTSISHNILQDSSFFLSLEQYQSLKSLLEFMQEIHSFYSSVPKKIAEKSQSGLIFHMDFGVGGGKVKPSPIRLKGTAELVSSFGNALAGVQRIFGKPPSSKEMQSMSEDLVRFVLSCIQALQTGVYEKSALTRSPSVDHFRY